MTSRRLVFDVESVGLHGECFAVGYVLLVDDRIVDEVWAYCPPHKAKGTSEGREWVSRNCPWAEKGMKAAVREEFGLPPGRRMLNPTEIRDWFWGVSVAAPKGSGD